MSYKSQLQTNNNTIVGNNTDLQSILNTINNLPSAGTGGTEIKAQAKTVTPTKSQQIIEPDADYNALSQVTVNAIPSNYITTTDATATASDIAKDKTAYVNGVKITGTHTCSAGSDTSDATATAEDILLGETAYINGGKVTGTMVVQSYYVGTTRPSDSIGNDGDLYLVRSE